MISTAQAEIGPNLVPRGALYTLARRVQAQAAKVAEAATFPGDLAAANREFEKLQALLAERAA